MCIKIMLADDFAQNHAMYGYYLSIFENLKVVAHAYNGREAIETCRTQPVDVILMDIEMPVMDGVESTSLIRQEFPEVVVIGLTGFDNQERVDALREAGAYGVATKSDDIKLLVNLIYQSVGVENLIT